MPRQATTQEAYGHEAAEEVLPEAEAAIRRALELDPELAEAHASLGVLHSNRNEGPQAVRELQRAIEVGPGYAEAHNWLSWVYQLLGEREQALQSAKRAVERNPLPPEALSNLAVSHLINGEAGKALDEARRAGVEYVVFVSVSMAGPDSPVLWGRLKHRIEEYLQASGLVYTIVRPTTFIETHALRLLGEPLRDKGKVSLMGDGTTPTNWISAEDLADYLVRTLHEPAFRNITATIGGPDVLSRVEVLPILEEALGRKAKRSHVPVAMLRAVRFLVGPFHPGIRYLLDFAVTDATMRDSREWSSPQLDWTAPTTVREVVERWAAQEAASPSAPAS